MQRETVRSLLDVCRTCDEITAMMENIPLETYRSERMLQLAVERLLEICGEALNRALRSEPELIEALPDARRVIGMRNHLAHGYDLIKVDVVWDSARHRVPELNREIETLLRAEGHWPE